MIRWCVIPHDQATIPNLDGSYDLVVRYTHDRKHNPSGAIIRYGGKMYRWEMIWCGWVDIDAAQLAILQADPEVLVAPTDIDQTLPSNAVTAVKDFLESIKIPAQWITMSDTYRNIIRNILDIFDLMNMVRDYIGYKSLFSVVSMGTQWQTIPAQLQTDLIAKWNSRGFDTSGLKPTTTIRQVLRGLSQQSESVQIVLSDMTL